MTDTGSGSPIGPGTELGGFIIEAVAGRGGMGVVYRARQKQPERVVAIKVISAELAQDPKFRARFGRESTIAAQIEHPNVVPVHAVGEADGVLYIAMRFIDGVDVRTLLAQEGRLEPRRAAAIVDQVAQALDAAHSRGLVHRDVKPANILIHTLGGRDHVYLTDFGLSRHIEGSVGLTGTGAFVGTIDYVAPEQARGEPVDARTDVYSLGCVLFQALTGTVPYPMDNELAKLYAHDAKPVPSALERAPDLPVQFESVLARAMAKAPDDRYLSAGDLGRAAVAAAAGTSLSRAERSVAVGAAAPEGADAVSVPPTAPTAPTTPPTRPTAPLTPAAGPPRRRRLPWLVGAAALLAAGVVAPIVVLAAGGGGGPRRAATLVTGSTSAACAGGGPPVAAQSISPPNDQLTVVRIVATEAPCGYRYVLVLSEPRVRSGGSVRYYATLRVAQHGQRPAIVQRLRLPYSFTASSYVSSFTLDPQPDGSAQVALSWSVKPGGANLTQYFTLTPGGITNVNG